MARKRYSREFKDEAVKLVETGIPVRQAAKRAARHSMIAVLLLVACAASTGCTRGAPRLRVLTYNIHHGEGTDGVFDLPRLAGVINAVRPDLVALQEVDQETERASGVDQAVELGRLTGMHVVYGKAMDYQGGGYGVAILSWFPVITHVNEPLPHSEGYEPRAALAVTVAPARVGELVFVATHLQHNSAEDRLAETRRINEVFARPDGRRRILAGDINARHGSAPMDALLSVWVDTAIEGPVMTFPSVGPDRGIDHVLYRPADAWRVVEIRVLDEEVASDHRPLLVVLEAVRD